LDFHEIFLGLFMEGCGASMSFMNTGSLTVMLYLEASRNFCVFLQFSRQIWWHLIKEIST
jgi:hypothetical protein